MTPVEERSLNDQIRNRLRRIEGQVRGIQRMLEGDRECEELLTQLMAVRSGIDQVGMMMMDLHIARCLLPEIPGQEERLRELREALRMWARFGQPAPAAVIGGPEEE